MESPRAPSPSAFARVLAAAAAAAWLAGAVPSAAQDAAPALTVTSATVQKEMWAEETRAAGAIEPWQEAVVSAQVGGQRLVEILAEVGDSVRAGQVLARFDAATLRAEEAELVASVRQAEASLREAEANRDRALALKERNLLSEQEVTRQVTQADVTLAQLAAAEARLATHRLELAYTEVKAPDAGVVSARSATLGAVAQPGEELFRLIRQRRLEWRGELTAQQLARVAPGDAVELCSPAADQCTARCARSRRRCATRRASRWSMPICRRHRCARRHVRRRQGAARADGGARRSR